MADYKAALERMNVEMELLRSENSELARKLQAAKEELHDAERRPRWEDRPDETDVVAGVLRTCGVWDEVSPEKFDRASTLVKSYIAYMFPAEMRPDFRLKENWNSTE